MRISDWSSDVCSSDLYRWTAGYLNGVIYFCHPRTGILELDLDTGGCQPIQATGLPSQPRAITVNQGRLVVLTDQVLARSEEHTSELQSLMRISYAVFC